MIGDESTASRTGRGSRPRLFVRGDAESGTVVPSIDEQLYDTLVRYLIARDIQGFGGGRVMLYRDGTTGERP